MEPQEVIIPLACFAMIFGIMYVYFTTQHRQRMALIEKGRDPNMINSYSGLRMGYTAVGGGIGLGIGWFIDSVVHRNAQDDNPLAYFISLFVCSGLALILAHKRVAEERAKAARNISAAN